MMTPLSVRQIYDCVTVERTSASLSTASTLTLIFAFWRFPRLRTLSNTLLFYASFANLGSNIAALIGGSGLARPNSALCQVQGFLLEWCMQADPMWGTCMAINVYLVIFRRWSAHHLKAMYKYYFAICYGAPLIPAFVCLFYRDKAHSRMYGDAVIWCWIDNDWALVRIYSYYGPIWVYILVTFGIYTRVGFEIFRGRSNLREFGSGSAGATHNTPASGSVSLGDNRDSWTTPRPSVPQQSFTGTRTTKIEVTHSGTSSSLTVPPPTYSRRPGNFVDITANEKETRRKFYGISKVWPKAVFRRINRIDKVKFAYTRVAFLFACAILITWAPSSANRVYSILYPDKQSYALSLAAAAVLPLQGFWNMIIFFWTSWGSIVGEYREWRQKRTVSNPCMAQRSIPDRPIHGRIIYRMSDRRTEDCAKDVLDDNSVNERATSFGHY